MHAPLSAGWTAAGKRFGHRREKEEYHVACQSGIQFAADERHWTR